jgi:hypothetical protein
MSLYKPKKGEKSRNLTLFLTCLPFLAYVSSFKSKKFYAGFLMTESGRFGASSHSSPHNTFISHSRQGCLLEWVCFANLGWAMAEKAARDDCDEMLDTHASLFYIELNMV